MNHCPNCGSNELLLSEMVEDVATYHNYYRCEKCSAQWEETVMQGGNLLSIQPYDGDDALLS